ncbi:MAG TPA: type II toxin-antitoxin system VapC family toxin [Thermoanaerobaculia bacterium]|nr:type II toxin-antitoxin system VapC family toxin [Thermoanaerobaculia bacterium]
MTGRAVLDASAAIHFVLSGDRAPDISRCLDDVAVIASPDLFCSEASNAVWKYVRAGHLTATEATVRLEEALNLIEVLIPGRDLAAEALGAATTYRHSVYDMFYAVAARRHGALLVTMDRAFARLLAEMKIESYCPLV